MERTIRELLLAVFLGMVLPGILLASAVKRPPEETVPVQTTEPYPETIEKLDMTIQVTDAEAGRRDLALEEYLVGVVLAEMPASFEPEALKAQAVVARTYTLKCVQAGKHGGGVCTDSGCCQAYTLPEAYSGGIENLEKVRSTVRSTAAQVLTYQGELIEATYFSCSGGVTEDAVAVWGTDFPYLRSVESPGEEAAAHYTDTVRFTAQEFENALDRDLQGTPDTWIGFTTYTAGGGVNTMKIDGVEYKGTELRALLGLRSTAFTMEADKEGISVTTRGFGHRVGMSQYGADAMAVAGSTYDEILSHYYSGAVLEVYRN